MILLPVRNGQHCPKSCDLADVLSRYDLDTRRVADTVSDMVKGRVASRFTDAEIAAKSRLPGPIVPGVMSMALMTQLLTGWAGPEALKDLDLVFRQPVPHNRPLTLTATITDLREEAGEHLVECDILMTGNITEPQLAPSARPRAHPNSLFGPIWPR